MDYPKSVPDVGLVNGQFADENSEDGTPGSSIPASWGNAVTEEILSVIRSTNSIPAENNNAQLKDAIISIADSRSPNAASTGTAGVVVLATQADAELGVDSSKSMSPLRVFQAISKSVVQSTESVSGVAKIATQAQVNLAVDDATIITPKKMAGAVQGQALVAFTTAGTSPAFTLTPVPAITAYATNQRFQVMFNAAGGATSTLNVSGLGAKSLKQYNSAGSKISAIIAFGQVSDVVYDGTDLIVLDQLPSSIGVTPVQFDSSTALATTAFVRGVGFQFGNGSVLSTSTTLTAAVHAGSLVVGNSSSAFTVTLPLASTMPVGSAVKFWCIGAGSMSVVASGSDSISTPFAITSFLIPFGAFATFVSNGSAGWFVIDLSGVGVGQTWQSVLGSRISGVTYTNATGKPIMVNIYGGASNTSSSFITVSGLVVAEYITNNTTGGAQGTLSAIVPPGAVYSVTASSGSIASWMELR